jgi:hypothetical protein
MFDMDDFAETLDAETLARTKELRDRAAGR